AARAFDESMAPMRAWAWLLRKNAICRTPATWRSSTKLPFPVSSRGSSVRLIRAPIILGRMCTWSVIGVGPLAQGLPLPVVVAVKHSGSAGGDSFDFGERFQQRIRVPGVARHDAVVERLADAHGVRRQQDRAGAVEPDERAH